MNAQPKAWGIKAQLRIVRTIQGVIHVSNATTIQVVTMTNEELWFVSDLELPTGPAQLGWEGDWQIGELKREKTYYRWIPRNKQKAFQQWAVKQHDINAARHLDARSVDGA